MLGEHRSHIDNMLGISWIDTRIIFNEVTKVEPLSNYLLLNLKGSFFERPSDRSQILHACADIGDISSHLNKLGSLQHVRCRHRSVNCEPRPGANTINDFRACLGAQLTICAQK